MTTYPPPQGSPVGAPPVAGPPPGAGPQAAPPGAPYVCRYCRLPSDASGSSCPNCGAPVDVRAVVSDSGWVEQPAIKDMARIQFGQSRCQIEGTLVPSVDFNLAQGEGVIFSHHTLLWTGPDTHLEQWAQGGFFQRMYAGMPLFLMRATGPGHVALSEDHPGEVVALPIPPGRGFVVKEHAFLACSEGIQYTWQNSPVWLEVREGQDEVEFEYPIGPYVDLFVAAGQRPGLLLLHCPGNLFVRDLGPGQTILVQPSAVVYSDTSINYSLHCEYPNAGGMSFWGSYNYRTIWLRLTGPGRVAVRSIFEKPERYPGIVASSGMTHARW
ncbi:MAG TPA: AIM24 family protein [Acidimicrobiales bacterium]|nr:AIM24 family protein [Acidimicrobiales bacterium]